MTTSYRLNAPILKPHFFLPVIIIFTANALFAQEKTFEREYTYKASEMDSKVSCRAIATNQLRVELLNEIGVYIESEQLFKSTDVSKEFSQDFVENITTLTAGITKLEILDERWNGDTFWMKAAITIDKKSLEKSLEQLIHDRQKTKELEDLKQQLNTTTAELDRLKKESVQTQQNSNHDQGDYKTSTSEKYNAGINTLISVDYLFNAEQKLNGRDYSGALEDYNHAIKINPNSEKSYYNRGVTKYALQDYVGAVEDYTMAIELNAHNEETYNNRGIAKSKLQNYKGALDDFTRAVQINPGNAHSFYNRGNLQYALKDYRRAMLDYNRSIEINQRFDGTYNNRGNLKFDLKDYQGAILDYNRAIDINPNNPKAYHNRGIANNFLSRYEDAINDFDQAIAIDSTYIDAYINRGLAKINSAKKDSGCSDFTRAAELQSERARELLLEHCQ